MNIFKALNEPETRQALLIAFGIWLATIPVFMAPTLGTPYRPEWWGFMGMATLALAGFLLTPILLAAVRVAERSTHQTLRFGLVIAAVIVVAVAHAIFDSWQNDLLMDLFAGGRSEVTFVDKAGRTVPAPFHYYLLKNFIILVWVHGGVAALAALSRFNQRVRRQDLQMAEAKAEARKAQLAAIRLQLSPHFMFNTLNALSGLILTGRNADAERMLARLSDFLRASLGAGEVETVALASELSAVGAYLDIESLRYDGRLAARVEFDDRLHDARVPTFLLQPLAEQAVAHAVSPPKREVLIRVAATAPEDDVLCIRITTGSSEPADRHMPALDLTAVQARLEAVYGASARLTGAAGPDGVSIETTLPLRRSQA